MLRTTDTDKSSIPDITLQPFLHPRNPTRRQIFECDVILRISMYLLYLQNKFNKFGIVLVTNFGTPQVYLNTAVEAGFWKGSPVEQFLVAPPPLAFAAVFIQCLNLF